MFASSVSATTARDGAETPPGQSPETGRGQRSVSSPDQVPDLVCAVLSAMTRLDYGPADLFAVRMALEEAAVNAVTHGHRGDPSKQARVCWGITPAAVKLVVRDEGPGFDPAQVPDPRLPENQDRPCGRGLLLIHAYMSRVRFNRRGNCIAMSRSCGKPTGN